MSEVRKSTSNTEHTNRLVILVVDIADTYWRLTSSDAVTTYSSLFTTLSLVQGQGGWHLVFALFALFLPWLFLLHLRPAMHILQPSRRGVEQGTAGTTTPGPPGHLPQFLGVRTSARASSRSCASNSTEPTCQLFHTKKDIEKSWKIRIW